jgi:hypothetical protein
VHLLDGLADRKSSEGEAVERKGTELVGVPPAEVGVKASLNDAEQSLFGMTSRE